jgi:fluoride exporter
LINLPIMPNYIFQLCLIFLGGGLGSLVRFFVAKQLPSISTFNLPLGTFLSNILASFILGLFIGYELQNKISENYRMFFAIGFCGGFSTFSTFSADTLLLIQSNRVWEALLNIIINVVLCILATFVGIYLFK